MGDGSPRWAGEAQEQGGPQFLEQFWSPRTEPPSDSQGWWLTPRQVGAPGTPAAECARDKSLVSLLLPVASASCPSSHGPFFPRHSGWVTGSGCPIAEEPGRAPSEEPPLEHLLGIPLTPSDIHGLDCATRWGEAPRKLTYKSHRAGA